MQGVVIAIVETERNVAYLDGVVKRKLLGRSRLLLLRESVAIFQNINRLVSY